MKKEERKKEMDEEMNTEINTKMDNEKMSTIEMNINEMNGIESNNSKTNNNEMNNCKIDKRNILDTEPFSYKITKDKKVLLYWKGKQVSVLKGKESERFLKRIQNTDFKQIQLEIAKITGNFKRGNEKDNKLKYK